MHLVIVEATPVLFDVPQLRFVTPSNSRIIPVQLAWAAGSPSGPVAVTLPSNGVKRMATGVLAL
eukprot:1929964-Karenia_brevis.AAC.1